MWVYTNSPTWELIGNNTPTWKSIGTVTWVYINTLTRELNRYRPDQTRTDRQTHFTSFRVQADRGFATSRLRSDEDGTILEHILHGSDWYIKKGGERSAGSGLNERFLSSASLLLKWYYILLSKYYKVLV
jgi:hypothetical protein